MSKDKSEWYVASPAQELREEFEDHIDAMLVQDDHITKHWGKCFKAILDKWPEVD